MDPTQFFIQYYYWMLFLNLILIIGIGAFLLPYKKARWDHIGIILAITLFSIYIRIPNIIVNDSMESLAMEYKVSSRTMFEEREYRMCYDGTISQCNQPYILPRHQHAHPFMASLSYYILGVSERSMTIFNMAISILTIVLVYAITFHIGRNRFSAIAAALTLSLFHEYIWWATSSEVVITNIFFILLSLFVISLAFERRSTWHYVLFFFVVMFSANVRSENIALLLLLGLAYIRKPEDLKKQRFPRVWPVFAFLAALILVMNIALVLHASRQHGPSLIRMSVGYLAANIMLIGEILISFRILLIPLAGFLVMLFYKRARDAAAFFLAYMLLHIFMIASFRQATADIDVRLGMGNLQRYAMPDFVIVIVLGMITYSLLLDWISRKAFKSNWRRYAGFMHAVILALYLLLIGQYFGYAMQGIPPISYGESGGLYSEILQEIEPVAVAVGSPEVLQYHQFISDVNVKLYSSKDVNRVSDEVTGYYFIELVSSHFPEFPDNPYYHSKGAVPYMIRGNFYIYNLNSYLDLD